MSQAIVIVEDDKPKAEWYKTHLEKRPQILSSDPRIKLIDEEDKILTLLSSTEVEGAVYIIDINLGPELNEAGFDIISKIRYSQQEILVIVISAYHSFEQRAIRAGADYFYVKGFNVQVIFDEIADLIEDFFQKKLDNFIVTQHLEDSTGGSTGNVHNLPHIGSPEPQIMTFQANFQPFPDQAPQESPLEDYYFAEKIYQYDGEEVDIWIGVNGQWVVTGGENEASSNKRVKEIAFSFGEEVKYQVKLDTIETILAGLEQLKQMSSSRLKRVLETLYIIGLVDYYHRKGENAESEIRSLFLTYPFSEYHRFLFQKKVFLHHLSLYDDLTKAERVNQRFGIEMPLIKEMYEGTVLSVSEEGYVEVELSNLLSPGEIGTMRFVREDMESCGLAIPEITFSYTRWANAATFGTTFELRG